MYYSLNRTLRNLDDATVVYPGHAYPPATRPSATRSAANMFMRLARSRSFRDGLQQVSWRARRPQPVPPAALSGGGRRRSTQLRPHHGHRQSPKNVAQAEQLRWQIRHCHHRYYVLDAPDASDASTTA
jgi:hypothetical protein